MYGYGYPYGFYVDPTYVLLIIGMVLALAASGKMKSTFARYQQVRSHSGLTGAQTAQRILNAAGIYDVRLFQFPEALQIIMIREQRGWHFHRTYMEELLWQLYVSLPMSVVMPFSTI